VFGLGLRKGPYWKKLSFPYFKALAGKKNALFEAFIK